MWVPVNQESFTEATGVAYNRSVELRAPSAEPKQLPGADDLADWRWQESEMSTDLALKLGFAVGSASANVQSRTLIAEFSRSKTIEQDGCHAQYGVCARLVVAVTGVDAKT